jgi:methionyl aminopeptidase
MIITQERDRRILREGGQRLARILAEVVAAVRAGMPTAELDRIARAAIARAGAEPAFLGYRGYPAAICTSRNEQVVHGIPSEKHILREGDICGLDLGIRYKGLYTDIAVTVGIGAVPSDAERLIAAARGALEAICATVRPGMTTGDCGAFIQEYVEQQGFNVVRDLVGHGVGRMLHEEPMLPNFGIRGTGQTLTEGMVLAFEPMVTAGKWQVRTLQDGWTVVTADGSLSSHFEHTVTLRKNGCEVLTNEVLSP